jgi:hypothetical protein
LFGSQLFLLFFCSHRWSPYGNGGSYNNGCGAGSSDDDRNGDDDEEIDNWYMGRTQCFRANAAYSLYGVLKGESVKGCNHLTYINSFFTDYGVEMFSSALGYAGVQNPDGRRYLEDGEEDDDGGDGDDGDDNGDDNENDNDNDSNENDENDNENDNNENDNNGDDNNGNNNNGDDDNTKYAYGDDYFSVDGAYYTDDSVNSNCYTTGSGDNNQGQEDGNGYSSSAQHGQKSYGDHTSYGIGCSGRNFVRQTFQGAFCDGRDVLEIADELKSFNTAIQHVSCVQIYSFTANAGSDDDEDENEGEDDDEGEITVQQALDLLKYSSACSIREFPRECPDPFGKLSKYNRVIERATGSRLSRATEDVRDILSVVLLLAGLIMSVASFSFFRRKKTSVWRAWDVYSHSGGNASFVSDDDDSTTDSRSTYSSGSYSTRNGRSRLLRTASAPFFRAASHMSDTSSRVAKAFKKYAEAENDDNISNAGGALVCTESGDAGLLDARQPGKKFSTTQNVEGDGLAEKDDSDGDSSYLNSVYCGRAQEHRNEDKRPATNTVANLSKKDRSVQESAEEGQLSSTKAVRRQTEQDIEKTLEHPMTLYRRNLVKSRAHDSTHTDDYRSPSPSSLLLAAKSLSAEQTPATDSILKDLSESKHEDSMSSSEERKRYKRPVLARISKTIFRKRKWKGDSKDLASMTI